MKLLLVATFCLHNYWCDVPSRKDGVQRHRSDSEVIARFDRPKICTKDMPWGGVAVTRRGIRCGTLTRGGFNNNHDWTGCIDEERI